ncbi:BatD family protein [Hydrogenimonas sp.]
MKPIPGSKWLLLLLLPLWLAASTVRVEVDKPSVMQGETVTFTIHAEGKDVTFPVVRSVDGFAILATAQKRNISIVNGSVTRSVAKSYTFAPMHDVTIPSFEVTVDGTTYRTDPVKVEVRDRPETSAATGAGPTLQMTLDKSEAHVGEPLTLEVKIRYPKSKRYVDVQVQKPEFANFWIKQLGDPQVYDDAEATVRVYRYLLFPQKAGDFELGPLTAKLARRVMMKPSFGNDPFFDDDFFNSMFARLEWQRIASNTLGVHVEPLPGGAELYGNFDLNVSVDRREVEANRPVRVTIRIEGYGNIDDVRKYDPSIPDAVVYADEPKIEAYIRGGRYGGTALQTVTIVADHNYTIPSLTLRYVDSESGKLVEKRSEPIAITVRGGRSPSAGATMQPPPALQEPPGGHGSEEKSATASSKRREGGAFWWAYLLFGAVLGAGGLYGWLRLRERLRSVRHKEIPIGKRIRTAGSDRELLALLLPYAKKSAYIDRAVRLLEENLFEKGRHRVDREELAWEVEELEEGR